MCWTPYETTVCYKTVTYVNIVHCFGNKNAQALFLIWCTSEKHVAVIFIFFFTSYFCCMCGTLESQANKQEIVLYMYF